MEFNQKVNFDVETRKGDIIVNVSYINKDSLDKAIDIMKETYESNPKYINPYISACRTSDRL